MFSGPTSYVGTVDSVMFYIVGISVVLLLGITAVMIFFVIKYNRKKGHEPVDIYGSVVLETIWIIIPTILVLSMFYYGYIGFIELRTYPEDSMEINVTARMWDWTFNYENGTKTDTLYVPLNQPIKLLLKSLDVNHSFFIPAFRVKEDVIGGKINTIGFKAEEAGSYDIACAEYCGLKHSMMYTKVVVMPVNEFNIWYEKKGIKN